MHHTFEEFAGRHIDGLYHGALFLNAGEERPAEDLVLWTLTGAVQAFRRIEEGTASAQWLEGKLVDVFLARTVPDSTDDGLTDDGLTDDDSTDDVSTDDVPVDDVSVDDPPGYIMSSPEPATGAVEIDHEVLFRSGANMPPLARAAIWLVLFRRWPYREASEVLKTDVDGLKDLLRYRPMLLTAVVRGSVDRNGTDHDLRH